MALPLLLGLTSCEGIFGVDFDDLKVRPTTDARDAGPDVNAAAEVDAAGCRVSDCPSAAHAVAVCEEEACALACEPGYHRCHDGCCALHEAPVAAGTYHTCATAWSGATAGALYCWGANDSGQLGDRTKELRLQPTLVYGLEGGARVVAVGVDFSLMAATSGAVHGWGANRFGTLADGTTAPRLAPWPVDALDGATRSIVAAGWHACALSRTGRASCWGYNVAGVLGVGMSPAEVHTPVKLAQEEPFAALATSSAHTCAVGVSGALYCWGNNDNGQIDADAGVVPSPVRVANVSDVAEVSTGRGHTCVATRAGEVRCWGRNDQSQLGVGDDDPRPGIVDVLPRDAAVRQIVAGDDFTCVVSASGAVSCWGFMGPNLGLGGGGDIAALPRMIDVGGPVSALSAGAQHACARLLDGRVRCWGSNTSGQLGDGTQTERPNVVEASFTN